MSTTAQPLAGTRKRRVPRARVVEDTRTIDEILEDMRAYGRKIRKTKKSTIAFLQRAGILDASGELAEPYRS